ncbi:hypothetical protein CYMTET_35046, partial [Cymbomonas tetramitiformis]
RLPSNRLPYFHRGDPLLSRQGSRFPRNFLRAVGAYATATGPALGGPNESTSEASRKPNIDFLASTGVSFSSLGMTSPIVSSLESAGFDQPTKIQAQAIPFILQGEDAVVAAETGSGKTLAYLAPIAHHISMYHAASPSSGNGEDKLERWPRSYALVLCPNGALRDQVVAVANNVLVHPDTALPVLHTHALKPGEDGLWRVSCDVVVTTPALLLNELMQRAVPTYRRATFFESVRHIVVDEADMLMTGGFSRDVKQIFQLLKQFQPDCAIEHLRPPLVEEAEGTAGGHQQEGVEEMEEVDEELPEVPVVWPQDEEGSTGGVEDPGKRRQYVFAAATVPSSGKKSVGETLKKLFKKAKWVQGERLHYSSLRLRHHWQKVDEVSWLSAVVDAVAPEDVERTMVFANTTESADQVSSLFRNF